MNYAIPCYEIHKSEKDTRTTMYSCTVEIGGIKYIGAAASTKKESEKKAARTALLAIAGPISEDQAGNSIYTVIPQKKKVPDPIISTPETKAAHKSKKARFKKKYPNKKWAKRKDNSTGEGLGVTDTGSVINTNGQGGVEGSTTDTVGPQRLGSGSTETMTARNTDNGNTDNARVPVDGCNDGVPTIMNVD